MGAVTDRPIPQTRKTVYRWGWIICGSSAMGLLIAGGVFITLGVYGAGERLLLLGICGSLVAKWKYPPGPKNNINIDRKL